MKKFLHSACICLALALGSITASAQKSEKPITSMQPLWGPTGYNLAAYYFLPDIDVYYDVPLKKFIYQENGEWVFSSSLPEKHKDYDLFSGYKVVLNRPHPYYNLPAHRVRYERFRGQTNRQLSIKDSTNPKYFAVEGHPRSSQIQAADQKESGTSLMKVAGN